MQTTCKRLQLPDLPQTFDLSYHIKSLTLTRRSLHGGPKLQHHRWNWKCISKRGAIPVNNNSKQSSFRTLTPEQVQYLVFLFGQKQRRSLVSASVLMSHSVAFVSVRIKLSWSHCESQRQRMWPDGDLCFYCVYTSWKCADGDSNYSEDERRSALWSRWYIQYMYGLLHTVCTGLHANTYSAYRGIVLLWKPC